MASNYDTIVWSPQSEYDIDSIFEYYLETSPKKAFEHIVAILNGTEEMVFSEQ